ncbi:hypothetical protein [Halorubrum laminariae]|uniref:Helix-hairpin-helix domain-containing protein n=1 Tax=Halorubrum laminariae TaxID=1433523 RepID=A0ABD6BZM3_9EURY|nr:hypothetical protein [Halorubrum laminariae]
MKSKKAEEVVEELRAKKPDSAGHCEIELVDTYSDETIDRFTSGDLASIHNTFRQHFLVLIKYRTATSTEQLPNRDNVVDTYKIPDWLQNVAQDFESVRLRTGEGDNNYSHKYFTLDDGKKEVVDDVNIRQLKTIIDKSKAQLPVTRSIRRKLGVEFDSFESIILADKKRLQGVNGIGEAISDKIYSRYSDQVREYVASDEYSDETTLPLIEDQDGVLRLPEEFEADSLTPKTPSL